ncbi:uncharacterized protein LOC130051230 isoform X3 [Ostrea edulis]|uniref:uncharacterized protein LOC130051230 isoform X3 n=1 Tax=Ostrea edulis TaxID=37623 RepID=UPI0024AFEE47|nr:uncharacterized protein LOC130051230 isoform X3 [Ostrea edulis]
MAGLKHTITFITAICWGSVLSVNVKWKKAMDTCIFTNQQPFSEDNATKNGSWVGKVKNSLPCGTGILQIQTVNKNNTCSDCDVQGKQCEFCNNRIQLNGSVAAFEVLKHLKSGRHYILAEFGKQSLSGLPPPTQCMVHRGASHTEYVTCNEKYDDGCQESGENVGIYITICFSECGTGKTQTDMDFVQCDSQESTGVGNGMPAKKRAATQRPPARGVGMKRNRRTTAQLRERSPNHTATSWTHLPEEILDSQWIMHRIARQLRSMNIDVVCVHVYSQYISQQES